MSYALTFRNTIIGPAEYRIAGNGSASPYTNVGLGIQENEIFPIVIPADTLISYWDVDDLLPSRPPSAIFRPTPVGGVVGGTGFSISSASLLQPGALTAGISGYLPALPLTLPDTNQGFEFRGFTAAVAVSDGGTQNAVDVALAGIAYYECLQAVTASITRSSGSSLLMRRNLVRSSSTLFTPALPLVDVLFRNPYAETSSTFTFTMSRSDLRPGEIDLLSSMIVFRGEMCRDENDLLDITLRNVKITGQRPIIPIGDPLSPSFMAGAGIEVGLIDACQGMVTLENVSVRDAQGEGFLGFASGLEAAGFLTTENCSFRFNGVGGAVAPYLQATGFSGAVFGDSGLHLIVAENGEWIVNDAEESQFSDNFRHGMFLEAASFSDEVDGFPLIDIDLCSFMRNGLDIGSDEVGHGLYATILDSVFELEAHRSVFSGNHSGGLSLLFRGSENGRAERLELTNSTFSGNLGIAPTVTVGGYPIDTNPISVVIEDAFEATTLQVLLSQLSVTDNSSAYAVALYGSSPMNQDNVFSLSSVIENCVLNLNGLTSFGGTFSDQAYYPTPPLPGFTNKWNDLFDATFNSNLGRLNPMILPAYIVVQENFYDIPSFSAFSIFGQAAGLVFPADSILVDEGRFPVVATEATDNRGPGNPRPLGGGYDVGSFETQ